MLLRKFSGQEQLAVPRRSTGRVVMDLESHLQGKEKAEQDKPQRLKQSWNI